MTNTLRITFAGICSHFKRVVPGIPHRVVLPNATGLHFGLVGMQQASGFGSYYLLPHFPVLLVPGVHPNEGPAVNGVIDGGVIVSGARLEIFNVLDREVHYDDSYYSLVPSIREYVPDYQFSNEVVLGERAAAYFDIFAGKVSGISPSEGRGAVSVVVEIETDGPPMLRVTPFGGAGSSAKPTVVTLEAGHDLLVGNIDVDPPNEDAVYDFLLHYLTSSRGIPQMLWETLPGLAAFDALPQTSHEQIARALQGLSRTIANHGPTSDQVAAMVDAPLVLGVSCSDSQYP